MLPLSTCLVVGAIEVVPIFATASTGGVVTAAIVSGAFMVVNTIAMGLTNWLLSPERQRARRARKRSQGRRRAR